MEGDVKYYRQCEAESGPHFLSTWQAYTILASTKQIWALGSACLVLWLRAYGRVPRWEDGKRKREPGKEKRHLRRTVGNV